MTAMKIMRRMRACLCICAALLGSTSVLAQNRTPGLLALCYHDVVQTEAETLIDPMAITVDNLVSQLSWLANHNYQPISIAQWQAAANGGPLPDNPVLLTFDDGYASFRSRVLPLLELYNFPAVLAPVSAWIDTPANQPVQYGDESKAREHFLTWADIREIQTSGLVEIASHSHDLHKGTPANPAGNLLPAAAAHRYDAAQATYEQDSTYRQRLATDLRTSRAILERQLGTPPSVIAWPYGAYNQTALEVAHSLGLTTSLTLDDAANTPAQTSIHRYLIDAETSLSDLVRVVEGHFGGRARSRAPLRAAHVDMDYIYDANPIQQQQNLDRLLDRIKDMQINAVLLQAFADPDGDGVADALYFPNRHLPVRADLFSHVAWQLTTRAEVRVFAWMPVLAFQLPDAQLNAALAVQSTDDTHHLRHHRLSPYSTQARTIIREIYADLGRHSRFGGVLFHDDAYLDVSEDVSHWAPGNSAAAEDKTRMLIDWTLELAAVLRRWQPGLLTARNLYARTVLQPESEQWFAQNYSAFLDSYDYTAVMAMPYLEQAKHPQRWLKNLVRTASAAHPRALQRTVFHLQTRDWRRGRIISDRTLARQFNLLLRRGALNIAYYPDDFLRNQPSLKMLRAHLSVNAHPALKK